MRLADSSIVFRKEMKDLLRDRRSVFAMFVFPILIHPIFLFGSAKLSEFGERRLEKQPVRVAVTGGLPELRERIFADSLIHPVEPENLREAVRGGEADAAFLLPAALGAPGEDAPEAVILFDESRDLSRDAKSRLEETAEGWRRERRDERLESLGLPAPDELLPIEKTNLASEERMTGGRLAKLMPVLLVFLLMNGASFAAVDLFAGERERKTIETLLTSRADRGSVVVGKFGTVLVASLTAAILFILSSLVMTRLGWIGPEAGAGFSVRPLSAAVVLLVSLPLAFLVSAFLVLVSSHARGYREAQTLLLPVLLIGILPAAVAMAPGIRFDPLLALAPVLNVGLAVRDALLDQYPILPLALTFLSNAVFAALLLRRANRYLTGEAIFLGAGGAVAAGAEARDAASVRGALVFYASMILVLYYFGSLVQNWKLIPGLLITLWAFLFLPTLLYARFTRLSLRRDLFIRGARVGEVLAGFLLAPALLLGAHLLFRAQSRFLPVPEELLEGLEKLMETGDASLALMIFAVAVSPGICEELLFRGLLLGRFRRVMSPARAVILSGLLFGIFHLSIYRILPTALLGAAAGALVLRTRSILPAVALHFLYDAIVILSSRFQWGDRIENFSGLWIGVSLGCALLAVILLRRRGDRNR